MKVINILIAEDHTLVAKLFQTMIEVYKNFCVVGVVSDGELVKEFVSKNKVDVILMDVEMPVLDGIQTLSYIKSKYPKIKVIMLSNRTESWIIHKALQLGALGYVTKYAESDEVIEAISHVVKGDTYLCKTSFNSLMKQISSQTTNDINSSLYSVYLTDREKDILKLISEIKTTKEIAEELSISTRTVETHRRNILHKLGLKNSLALVKEAVSKDDKSIE